MEIDWEKFALGRLSEGINARGFTERILLVVSEVIREKKKFTAWGENQQRRSYGCNEILSKLK